MTKGRRGGREGLARTGSGEESGGWTERRGVRKGRWQWGGGDGEGGNGKGETGRGAKRWGRRRGKRREDFIDGYDGRPGWTYAIRLSCKHIECLRGQRLRHSLIATNTWNSWVE